MGEEDFDWLGLFHLHDGSLVPCRAVVGVLDEPDSVVVDFEEVFHCGTVDVTEFVFEFVQLVLHVHGLFQREADDGVVGLPFGGRAPSRHELVEGVHHVGIFEVDVVNLHGVEVVCEVVVNGLVFVFQVVEFFPVCFGHDCLLC